MILNSRFSEDQIMLLQKAALNTLVVLLCGTLAAPAQAWDAFGHMTVASVCYQRLTEHTRARVDALLKLNPMHQQWEEQVGSRDDKAMRIFTLAATWPDIIKGGQGYTRDSGGNGNIPGGPEASQNIVNAPESPSCRAKLVAAR